MTELRQRMIEAMVVRGFAERTQESPSGPGNISQAESWSVGGQMRAPMQNAVAGSASRATASAV